MLVAVILFLVGGLVALAIGYAFLAPRWHEARVLRERLEKLCPARVDANDLNPRHPHVLSDIPWLDTILRRIPRLMKLERLRQQAGSTTSLGTWLLLSAVCGLFFWFSMSAGIDPHFLVSIGSSMLGFALPFLYLTLRKKERIKAFQAQFPEALDMLTRTIQAGNSLAIGMQLVGDEFKEPLGLEFKRTIEQVQRWGISFQDAMRTLPERIESLDLKFFVIALTIQRESGGNLTEVLESLSNLIRRRFELKDRVRALSAEGKLSAIILFSLPFVLAIMLSFSNPTYLSLLFTHEMGEVMLSVGLGMMTIGALVIKKMISFRV